MGPFSRRKYKKERSMIEQLMARLDGKELQYVVRRSVKADGSPLEEVLGKGGRIMAPGDFVAVYAGQKQVFINHTPATVTFGELMALNGVRIEGHNELTDKDDVLLAYYSYYRK